MINNEEIIRKLRDAKKECGITLKELSQKSGISQGTVNKIMSGALRGIKTDQLAKLSQAMGVSPSAFLDEKKNAACSRRFLGYVRIAAVSPRLKVGDCNGNTEEIIRLASKAADNGVAIALFPELCVTGYTCGDLLFNETLRKTAWDCVIKIRNALSAKDIAVIIGFPFENGGRLYNAAAVLQGGKILGIIPKTHLPNYNEFAEKRYFAAPPSDNQTVVTPDGEVLFGAKLLFKNVTHPEMCFACEICEDIWVAAPPSCTHAEAGATIICNLSASNETVVKADYRKNLVVMQSAKTNCIYAYCSSGPDESTTDLVFSAHNIIAENGNVIAEAPPFGSGYAQADADCGFIAGERAKLSREPQPRDYATVTFEMPLTEEITRLYSPSPFVPEDKDELAKRCKTVYSLQAYALKKRLEHTGAKKLVLGVSGGSDSSLALIASVNALKLANRPLSDLIAVTMPCFGTTRRTYDNSVALARAYGAEVRTIDLTETVSRHLKDIGHNGEPDVVYENAQARERTQVLMDIANAENGIVVGTGDLSEAALGWSTYNGDHMSMYAVNCSVPKTFVKCMLKYEADRQNAAIGKILYDIVDTPVSPELLPDGAAAQKTEDILGPYELHDYFLYMFVRMNFSPSKIYALAKISFKDVYSSQKIYQTLEIFLRRFFGQQFKRSCVPDGVKIGSVSLSPRGDFKMPSDACADLWLENLRTVKPV